MPAWSVPGTHSVLKPLHAVVARQRVHDRLVERMAHVQRAGHVGRRQLDAERGLGRVQRRHIGAAGFPQRAPARLDGGGFEGFGEFGHGMGRHGRRRSSASAFGTFGDGLDCRRRPRGAAAGAWPRIAARRAQPHDERQAPRIEPHAAPAPTDARHRPRRAARPPVAGPQDPAVLRRAAAAGRAAGLAGPAAHAAPCQADDAVGQRHRQLPRHGRQAGGRGGAPARQHPQPGLGRFGGERAAAGRRPESCEFQFALVQDGTLSRRRRAGAAGPAAAARIADHPGPRPGAGAHAARPGRHAHRHRPGRQRHASR